MATTTDSKQQPIKARQINVRVTAEQDLLLKQYCVRNDVTTASCSHQSAAGLIDGF